MEKVIFLYEKRFFFPLNGGKTEDPPLYIKEMAVVTKLEVCSFYRCSDVEEDRLKSCGLLPFGTWGVTWVGG